MTTIDLMTDEIIKELIKEQAEKKKIKFPVFLSNGKYFNTLENDNIFKPIVVKGLTVQL